jgi:hypothetical protein
MHFRVTLAPACTPNNARMRTPFLLLAGLAALGALPGAAVAHGLVGQRFFPATIATEDPFVADELALPTLSSVRHNGDDETPASRQATIAVDFAKRITPDLAFSIGAAHQRFSFADQTRLRGFENVELGLKKLLYKDEAGEALVSAGLSWEIGGSGSRAIGERFDTYTPTVFFGKGFGNVASDWLRPFAVTGTVGVAIPGRSSTSSTTVDPDTGLAVTQVERNPHVLQLGLALQYSIPYLQSAVKDIGLTAPWKNMVPVIELAAQRPLDRVDQRSWTGTINPGVLWPGKYVQFGLEAVIPLNRASGHGVGVLAQLHFFLDDLFPQTVGRPLLAAAR